MYRRKPCVRETGDDVIGVGTFSERDREERRVGRRVGFRFGPRVDRKDGAEDFGHRSRNLAQRSPREQFPTKAFVQLDAEVALVLRYT